MGIPSPVRSLHAESPNAFSSKQIKEVAQGKQSARHGHLAKIANLPSSGQSASVARRLPVESGSQGSGRAPGGYRETRGALARSLLEALTGGRSFRGVMGGLWCPGWRLAALCGRGWSQLGWAGRTVVNAERVLRPGWNGLGGAERGLRRLGTWKRPSGARGPAAQPPRRPRSSNPFQRAQEDEWRRRNKTVLTYVAAAAVGMLGASYAAVPLYRLYCQVGRDEGRHGSHRRHHPAGGASVTCRGRLGSRSGRTCPRSLKKTKTNLHVEAGSGGDGAGATPLRAVKHRDEVLQTLREYRLEAPSLTWRVTGHTPPHPPNNCPT